MPAPDLERWAASLRDRIKSTPTDFQGHEDVPEDAAHALVEALDPAHLERFADALLEAAPALREHFVATVLEELSEEVARREDSRHAHATVELISQVEQDWRNDV